MKTDSRIELLNLANLFGEKFWIDSIKCRAILSDVGKMYSKSEIFALVSAVSLGLPKKICSETLSTPWVVRRLQYSKTMEEETGIQEQLALWSLDGWAMAFGKIATNQSPSEANAVKQELPQVESDKNNSSQFERLASEEAQRGEAERIAAEELRRRNAERRAAEEAHRREVERLAVAADDHLNDFDAKRKAALGLLKETGMLESNYCPPILRLLWRIGVQVRPPHFASFGATAVVIGAFVAVLWATFFGLAWHFLVGGSGIPIIVLFVSGALFGAPFALFISSYYEYGRRKHRLPKWSSLGGSGEA